MPDDPFARAKRAARKKRAADREYRSALCDLHDAGHSFAEIARAVGVARQNVRVLVGRARQGG